MDFPALNMLRRQFIKTALKTILIVSAPTTALYADEQKKARKKSSQKQKEAPFFAVISDTHMKSNDKESDEKIRNTLSYLSNKKPDAIFIVGDVTNNGDKEQYELLAKAVKETVPNTIPVYFTTGNHDLYNDAEAVNFRTVLKQEPNQYFELKGHPFITVGMNSKKRPYYDDTAVTFLKQKLEEASVKYPEKPIFVFYHVPLTGTVYGSGEKEGWGSPVLAEIVNKYPQIIAFSGHSHFPIGDERSIHQDKFTAVNLGSVTYSEIEKGFIDGIHPKDHRKVTEAVTVEPVENRNLKKSSKYHTNYIIKRWDTFRQEKIKNTWLVYAPHDGSGFIYKNRKGATHYFDENTVPSIKDITSSSAIVEWKQAKTAGKTDNVHHYLINVFTETGEKVLALKKFSQFYLNSAKPENLSQKIEGLKPDTAYKIEIKAVDSWYTNVSLPITSYLFKTTNL